MAKRYYLRGAPKQMRHARHALMVMLLILVPAIIFGIVLLIDLLRTSRPADNNPATAPVYSTVGANTKVQSTAYFNFQTNDKWRIDAKESTDTHFVYREYKGQVVDQELVIDVGNNSQEVLANTLITRVLPVTVSPDGALSIKDNKLEHCKKYVPAGDLKQQMAVYQRASFPCNPDSEVYSAVVALVDGNNVMSLPRPDGSKAVYKIKYRNFSAVHSGGDFSNIIKTFETR